MLDASETATVDDRIGTYRTWVLEMRNTMQIRRMIMEAGQMRRVGAGTCHTFETAQIRLQTRQDPSLRAEIPQNKANLLEQAGPVQKPCKHLNTRIALQIT